MRKSTSLVIAPFALGVMRIGLTFVCGGPGCFNPSYHNPTCSVNGECPSGLVCVQTRVSVLFPTDRRYSMHHLTGGTW